MNVMINNMVPMSLWATAKAQPWNRIMQGHGIGILNKDPRSNYMQYDIHQHLLTGIGVHIYASKIVLPSVIDVLKEGQK